MHSFKLAFQIMFSVECKSDSSIHIRIATIPKYFIALYSLPSDALKGKGLETKRIEIQSTSISFVILYE